MKYLLLLLVALLQACSAASCDAPATCIAQTNGKVNAVAADQSTVFWIEDSGAVNRSDLRGHVAQIVPPSGGSTCADAIALSATDVYFAENGSVWHAPRSGGQALMIQGTDGRRCGSSIVVADGQLFWATSQQIWSLSLSAGPAAAVADTGKQVVKTFVYNVGSLYWAVDQLSVDATPIDLTNDLGVWSLAPKQTPSRIIANSGARQIAVDSAELYFVASDGIHSAHLDGSNDRVLIGQNSPLALLSDGNALYWIGLQPGDRIRRRRERDLLWTYVRRNEYR